jgi:Domain of unknown function (DUF4157)
MTLIAGANAIVFGRRIFLSPSAERACADCTTDADRLLAHELMHVRQYRRFGMAAFLGRYVGEYLRLRLAGAAHGAAYRAISFERGAEDSARAACEPPGSV